MTRNIAFNMTKLTNLFVSSASQIVKTLCASKHRRFMQSLEQPLRKQEQLLNHLLIDLSKTEYGRSLGVSGIETYEQFANIVPVVNYEELAPLVAKQIITGQPVLTPHHIVHVEPTSGSSGASKKILYTKKLLNSFSNMFCIWAFDLLDNGLHLKTGKIFLSISPSLQISSFSSDANYLDGFMGALIAPFIVSPSGALTRSNHQQKLAETILLEEKLEVISIWSPSYLLSILHYIENNRLELSKLVPENRAQLLQSEKIDWQKLFPHLQLISCWDSAHSSVLASQLRDLLPSVKLQGKGLLATECAVTVPLTGTANGAPLINDVFLEFEDGNGLVRRLHETTVGDSYQLIISQKAGLTRYRLNDIVMVCDPLHKTPTLKFLGKANIISDMVGEKLHEFFVRDALNAILPRNEYLLIPQLAYDFRTTSRYILLAADNTVLDPIALDLALCQSFHYRQARQSGQLSRLEVIAISELKPRLQQFLQNEGQKLGDIKDLALMADIGRASRLLEHLNINSETAIIAERHLHHSAV